MHGFLWGAVFSRVVLHEYGSNEQIAILSGERHCIQMAAQNSSLGELFAHISSACPFPLSTSGPAGPACAL